MEGRSTARATVRDGDKGQRRLDVGEAMGVKKGGNLSPAIASCQDWQSGQLEALAGALAKVTAA